MSWLDGFFGSLRNIFGSLWTSSDIIGALGKTLALSGEKCHAYKFKKSWQVYIFDSPNFGEQLKCTFLSVIEGFRAKRAYIAFRADFHFCRINLIFRGLTCVDMKSIVV